MPLCPFDDGLGCKDSKKIRDVPGEKNRKNRPGPGTGQYRLSCLGSKRGMCSYPTVHQYLIGVIFVACASRSGKTVNRVKFQSRSVQHLGAHCPNFVRK